jgi:hypothetical protein
MRDLMAPGSGVPHVLARRALKISWFRAQVDRELAGRAQSRSPQPAALPSLSFCLAVVSTNTPRTFITVSGVVQSFDDLLSIVYHIVTHKRCHHEVYYRSGFTRTLGTGLE